MFCHWILISALSILAISRKLLQKENVPFEYVQTNRFLQDTIEMLFSKTSRMEYAVQLEYVLMSLLLENDVEARNKANCVLPPGVNVPETAEVDTAISNLLLLTNTWRADLLYYTPGYIVRQILKSIDFSDCAEALFDNTDTDHIYHTRSSLLLCKRYGNLTMPPQSVYTVASIVDKFARKELCS